MLTLIKWLFGLLFALVLLLVAAVIILPMVVDPNDYKDQITNLVKEKTGRDLTIQQDLKLSVFPWLGIETGQVVLGNAPGFGDKPFAQIKQLGLKVKLLPLIKKQIEVDTLILDGLQLNLAKNKQGTTNWADLQQAQAEPKQQTTTDSAEKTTDATPLSFSVQGVQISNAWISWQDQQAGKTYQLNNFNLTTGGLYPGAASQIETDFAVSSVQPPLESTFKLKTQLQIGDALKRFGLKDLALQLDAKGPLLPQSGMQLDLFTQAALDLAQDRLMLKGLKINGPEISLTGDVSIKQLQQAPDTQASIQLQETNLKKIASLFGVVIQTQQDSAMTRFSADMQVHHQGDTVKLEPLNATLDESKLTGHLYVLETGGPTVRTKLNIDQINLDHYLPPPAEQPAAAEEGKPAPNKPSGEAAKPSTPGNPFAALRTLDLQAEARIGKLTVNKMRLQDILVKAVNKKGVLQLEPINAQLYQGSFKGAVTLNAQGKKPQIRAVKKLTGVQIGELLTDLTGEGRLLGQANMDLDVRTTGLAEADVRQSLNGKAEFKILDGAYKGVNIAQLVRETGAALGLNTATSASNKTQQTDFSELTGSFNIKNGVINNQDLSAKSPLLRIEGKGSVDLSKDTVDYLLTTVLVGSIEGQGGKGRNDLSGVPIPIKIEGPLANPNYRPEFSEIINKKAEERIKQEVKKAEQKLEQTIGQKIQEEATKKLGEDALKSDDVKDVLKGLFGR